MNMRWGPVISVLLVLIIIISSLLLLEIKTIPEQASSNGVQDPKAMVTYISDGWAENSLNLSEIVFDVALYNYGYHEAKNVEVSCQLYSADAEGNSLSETPILDVSQKTGNVASTSYKKVQVYAIKNSKVNDYSLSSCAIVSCEDCEILDERLT